MTDAIVGLNFVQTFDLDIVFLSAASKALRKQSTIITAMTSLLERSPSMKLPDEVVTIIIIISMMITITIITIIVIIVSIKIMHAIFILRYGCQGIQWNIFLKAFFLESDTR